MDLFILEESVPIATSPVGLSTYDFDFRSFFRCRSLITAPPVPVVARLGAIDDYHALWDELASTGIRLIHTPEQHDRCSLVSGWYPLLDSLTPESVVLDALPAPEVAERLFGWPLFIKGDRQTSRHRTSLTIARDARDYERIRAAWSTDRILHWQRPALRRFVPLRHVGERADGLPASFEFRVFCWRGRVVGLGRYWVTHEYAVTGPERDVMLALAAEAARRVNVPFLVVDVAQAATGEWIVIECNDAQECGYAGVVPLAMWADLLDVERPLHGPDAG